jgi:hypoxanthine phosphoribosyltransferase
MVVIAIAGGGGRLALSIAEVLKENPKHKVIILSRKVRISPFLTP